MAKQTADDLHKVSQMSEDVGAWYGQTPWCWERARFLEFPVEELRGAKLAYCFPTTEHGQTEEIDGRLVALEEPFVCDENEGDDTCNQRIANYRQAMAHKTRKHGVRSALGLLTRTNECPWCRSRFFDRETALHHVYNATGTKGTCYINFSRPHDLKCRLCEHEAQDFEEFQLHARTHHAGSKGFVKTTDGRMESGKRATPEGEENSARDSKLPKSGGKGSIKASARSAASYEDTLARSIVALRKLSLKHDQEIRELAGALTDFWLAPKSLQPVKAGMEAGADYMEEVKKRGRRTRRWQRHSWKLLQPRRRGHSKC